MSHPEILRLTSVVLVLVVGGCNRGGDKGLPPATGSGAPPLPTLPKMGAASSDEGAPVAPTEGRTTGTTFPRAEAQLGPNTAGVITRILVEEGARVRRGAVLFRLDTRDGALRVDQARAALAAAQVELNAVETEHGRTKALFDAKAVNTAQWDQIQTRRDGARVGVQQAQVALRMAAKALADATVRSPIDGVVTAKLKNEGEMATMMPPTIVLVVQDQSAMELRFRLPERELQRIKVGDGVTAKFEALGVARGARVVRIQQAVDPHTRTVEIVAELPNKDGTLRSGLLAEVQLDTPSQAKGP